MNLLVFNLAMDADDSVLGHTTAWTNALARRCDHVSVITMRAGRLDLEANVSVRSLGKERGCSEPRRLLRFYRHVHSVLRERRIEVCFAHMAPLFTVLFAPVAKRAGIPILLWYAHTSVTPTLRLAHAAADRCVTSAPAGFRLRSDKLFVIGQGVDVERFRPSSGDPAGGEVTAVSVGRISAVKRIEEMLHAIDLLRQERGLRIPLRLIGGPHTAEDRRVEASLKRLARGLDLNGLVRFEGPLPFDAVPDAYRGGTIFLNLSETGSIDKAILESMASGLIPISRNASFRALARTNGFEWLVPGPGATGVAERVADVLGRPREERIDVARRMRRVVVEQHSLERLAEAIIDHAQQLSAARAGAG